jgi:S1-C subfamily serine protease
VNALDVVIVVAAVLAAFGGYRLGFFTRVLSWVGLGVGIYLAARFSPRLISAVNLHDAGARLVLAALILVGAAFVGQAAGMLIGARLHGVLPSGRVRAADKGVGAIVGVVGVLTALWLLLPAVSSVAGWPARATRASAISRWVSDALPAPPDTVESLRRLVGNDEFPQVFNSIFDEPAAGPPPTVNPLSTPLTRAVMASTVRVEGQACNQIQEGSGVTVAPGLIVTNAHVVAGEPAGATSVLLPSGRELAAAVVTYDPDRDLAVLLVPGLTESPLPLAQGTVGTAGAVLGHPGGQVALAVQPASIASEITATGRDLYNRHNTTRDVYVLAAHLAPGDSGGPLVDRTGHVVGIAFAISLASPATAYALTSREVDEVLATPRTAHAVSTQACLNS